MASPNGTTLPVKCASSTQINEAAIAHSPCTTQACVENGGGSTHFFIDASTLLDEGEVGMPSPRLPPAEQVTASFHKELSFEEPTRPKPVPRHLPANAVTHVERPSVTSKHGDASEDRHPTFGHNDVTTESNLNENAEVSRDTNGITAGRQQIVHENGDVTVEKQLTINTNADVLTESLPISVEFSDVLEERQPICKKSPDEDSSSSHEKLIDLNSHLESLYLDQRQSESDPFSSFEEKQATGFENVKEPLETIPKPDQPPILPMQGWADGPPKPVQETRVSSPPAPHRHADSPVATEQTTVRIPPQPTPRTRLPSTTNQQPAAVIPANETTPTTILPNQRMAIEIPTNQEPAAMIPANEPTPTTILPNQRMAVEIPTNQQQAAMIPANDPRPTTIPPNQRVAVEIPTNQQPAAMIPANDPMPIMIPPNQRAAVEIPTNRTALGQAQADILSELATLLDTTERSAIASMDFHEAADVAEQRAEPPASWTEDTSPCPPASLQPATQGSCPALESTAASALPFTENIEAQVCSFEETSLASLPHATATPPGSPSPCERRALAPPLSLRMDEGESKDSFSSVDGNDYVSLEDVDAKAGLSLPRGFVLHDAALRSEEERRQGNAIFQARALPPGDLSLPVEATPAEALPVEVAAPAKRPCGFFVDLAELPSPEAPPPPPARNDAGNALFSMFIDFSPPSKPRNGRLLRQGGPTAREEPIARQAGAAKPIESQLGKNKPLGSQTDINQIESQICKNKPIGSHVEVVQANDSHYGKNMSSGSHSDLSQPMGGQTRPGQPMRKEFGLNESDEAKARRPRLACVSDSDSPLPRRRSSTSSRQPSQRHSWNPDAASVASTTRKHRRASSLSHSLTEDTSSSLSATVELGSVTLGTVDVSTSRTFSASSSKAVGKSEVSIVSDTISEGRMITEEEAQDLTDVDEIAADAVVPANEPASFVKLSDMDTASPVPTAAHAPRMTQSIPEGAWPSAAKPGMSRSVQGGCSRSLGRLFPHLMTSSAEESELSDASLPSSMHTSAMEGSTEESGGSPATRLGEDLLRMFLEEISPDVTLDVGGRRIRAHKCILASRCQYFAAVLSGGWVTSAGDLISLQGFSYNAVFFALCHIYSGTGDVPDAISLVELATLADMLALEGLKEVVSMALRAKFCHFFHKPCAVCSVGVVECLPLAAAYGLDDIYRRALRWIAKHFVRIWPTKGFAALPRELIEKCYQQIVVHMSAESVLETVLGADKLLATLPSARWAEPVFALASQLLDSAVRFAAHHLGHVLSTPSFQSLGGEQSWNIGRLEESLVRAADRMPPEQACLSIARLDSWLNDSPTVQRSAAYSELLRRLSLRAEARLVACGARSVRAASWQRVPLRVRERVAAASNIDLEAAAAAAELAAAQRRPQPTHRSLTGSRHLDLRQVKLAMTQQARRQASGGRVSALTNDSRPRRQPVAVIHPRQVTEPRPAAAEPRPLVLEPRPRPPVVEVRPPVEPVVVVEARPVVENVAVDARPAAVESRPVAVENRPAVDSRLREQGRVNGEVRGRRKLISSSDSSRAGSPALHRPARVTATTASLSAAPRPSEPRPSELDMSTDSLSSPRTTGAAHSPHSPLLPPSRRPRAPLISPRESHTSRLRSAAAAAKAAAPPRATPVRTAPAKATPSKATPLRSVTNKAAPVKATSIRDTPTPARANRVVPLKGAGPKKAAANPVKAVAQALGSRSGTFLKDEPSILRKPSAN